MKRDTEKPVDNDPIIKKGKEKTDNRTPEREETWKKKDNRARTDEKEQDHMNI